MRTRASGCRTEEQGLNRGRALFSAQLNTAQERDFPMAQWSRLCTLTAGARVPSLAGEGAAKHTHTETTGEYVSDCGAGGEMLC